MSIRMVTCKNCKRRFNRAKGSYIIKGKRGYYCKKCGLKMKIEYNQQQKRLKRLKKLEKQARNLEKTGMKQSYFAMILKILSGAAYIYIFGSMGMPYIIPGILLILLGVVPFY